MFFFSRSGRRRVERVHYTGHRFESNHDHDPVGEFRLESMVHVGATHGPASTLPGETGRANSNQIRGDPEGADQSHPEALDEDPRLPGMEGRPGPRTRVAVLGETEKRPATPSRPASALKTCLTLREKRIFHSAAPVRRPDSRWIDLSNCQAIRKTIKERGFVTCLHL